MKRANFKLGPINMVEDKLEPLALKSLKCSLTSGNKSVAFLWSIVKPNAL